MGRPVNVLHDAVFKDEPGHRMCVALYVVVLNKYEI